MKNTIQYLFIALAVIILLDFLISKESVKTKVKSIHKEYQSHNNASKNFHYSHYIITDYGKIYITEQLSQQLTYNDSIMVSPSFIFNAINKLTHNDYSETHILRYIWGIAVPILSLIILVFALFKQTKLSTITFVMQFLVLADLIYLMVS